MLNKTRAQLQIILGLALVGWVDAAYSLWHRQKIFLNGLDGKSFCSINAAIDCDAVALTSYSSLMGIPTAAWGMVFYSILILLGLWTYFLVQDQKDDQVRPALSLLLISTLVGLVPTVALAGVSFFVIRTLCLMCLLTYLLNIALAALTWNAYFSSSKAQAKNHGGYLGESSSPLVRGLRSVPQALWLTAAVLVALQLWSPVVVNSMIAERAPDDSITQLTINQHFQNPVRALDVGDAPAEGPANAPVTIVEFSDMQCPHCARSAQTLPPLLRQYGDRVRHAYKNYPLDSSCNKNIQGAGHGLACLAAKTGYCVNKLNGYAAFFDYKQNVFAHQTELSPERIRDYAAQAKVAPAQLEACVADAATQQAIVDQVAQGAAAGIEGTPAIFVNGRLVDSGPNPLILKAILDRELSGK